LRRLVPDRRAAALFLQFISAMARVFSVRLGASEQKYALFEREFNDC
jgi:hypothetical protein